MPRLGVSFASVKDAAERLETQGLAPTVMRVRAEVGGTGSLSTIARHLKEWRQANGTATPVTGVLMPSPFSDETSAGGDGAIPVEVGQIARSAWQRLADLAAEQVAEAQARCDADKQDVAQKAAQQIAQAQQQAAEQHEAAQRQVAQADAATQRAEQQATVERQERQKNTEQAAQRGELQAAQCASLDQQLQTVRGQADELNKRLAISEIGRHKAEEARDMAIERQRSSEAQSQARMDKAAHVEQQRMTSVVSAFEKVISAAKDEQARLHEQLLAHATTLSRRHAELENYERQIERLEAQLNQSSERLQRAESLLAHSEQVRASERTRLDELQRVTTSQLASNEALSTLQQQFASIDARLSHLSLKH